MHVMFIKISTLLHAFCIVYCTGLCTDRFASEQQVTTEGHDRLEHERQIIVPYLQFMCNGRITRLIVGTDDETGKRNGGPNPLIFQIWTPTVDATYRLSGLIELPEGVTTPGNPDDFLLVNFSIPTDVNLFFHHGDVVGYYQPNELRARIWTIRNSSYVAYRLRADNYTTTIDLNDDAVDDRNERQPLIQVIYESVCIKPTVQYGTVSCSPSDDNGTLVAVGGRCSIQCDVWRTPVNSGQQMECLPSGLWSYQAECVMATTSSFRGSSNGAAIAGGLAAGCFVLMVLLAVVIVIWYHRRRLGISFQWKVTSSNGVTHNSGYLDRDTKADNVYHSPDKGNTKFKENVLSTTINDNRISDRTVHELPPQTQPVNATETNPNSGYEYISNSVVIPKTSKASCYERLTQSESQAIIIDYSKNVVRWQKKSDEKDESLSRCNPYEEAVANEEPIYEDPGTSTEKIYAYFEQRKFRKISPKDLRINQRIGSGQFGIVYLGLWSNSSTDPVQVAVKTLNSQCAESDRVKFLREAAIMGQFVHNNVVRLHGVVTEEENMMIVLEYIPKGDLRGYLSDIRSVNSDLFNDKLPEVLLSFCRQIAAGMNYLANKQFVHRDLAARNILVSSDDVCKIADFGMARDVADNSYYVASGGKIPVKWTAPEALLYQKYSAHSDVWSYGCVLYEIWSIGHTPFGDVTAIAALHQISRGYRLPPPPGCPKAVYQLMIHCWHSEPKMRPLFARILIDLRSNQETMLSWSQEDLAMASKDATVLGGPLSAGKNLFVSLQNTYKS